MSIFLLSGCISNPISAPKDKVLKGSETENVIIKKEILNTDTTKSKFTVSETTNEQRVLTLWLHDKNDKLIKKVSNSNIIPCGECGDSEYDINLEKDSVIVEIEGGGWERWNEQYIFHYDSVKKDWYLAEAARSVVDTANAQLVNTVRKTKESFNKILKFSDVKREDIFRSK
ncbi:hypothetical protein [Neisseria sp. CCUG12390]|uniref:hypothetical protein n=1 Tax=Neisseria sp. CCUG12390 TaxID=3392035 RepID=UPI003A0FF517